jgi:branched-chain amino acid aminotransferase
VSARAPGPRHVWIDGQLAPADVPHLSAFDRGFQLGDGVFETLRAKAGRPTEIAAHLARLRQSADGLGIELPRTVEADVATGIQRLLEAESLAGPRGDAAIRVTVSRGAFFGRGLLPPADAEPTPTVVVQAWPVTPPPAGHVERGIRLVTSQVRRDPSSPLGPLKTTSRADHVYARLEAKRAGADDALFLTIDGHLSEATTANLFLVSGTSLGTPSLACGILAGTTRDWVLRWGARVGLEPTEGVLRPDDLAAADEAFLSSSVAGILPIREVDGHVVGTGEPGPWTLRARRDREAFVAGS